MRAVQSEEAPATARSISICSALIVLTAFGAWLRFRLLGLPSLWLDELLNVVIVRKAGELRPWEWLIGFERENGPLYFALQWLGLQLTSSVELGARIFPALIGSVSVPLAYTTARRCGASRGAGCLFAAFLALSPLHVYYSREGRTYALLVFAALLMMNGLADLHRARSLPWLIAGLVVAVWTAASSAPLLMAGLFAVTLWLLLSLRKDEVRRRASIAALIFVAGFAMLPLLYLRFPQIVADPFRTPLPSLFITVANGFVASAREGSVLERISIVLLILAMVGLLRVRTMRWIATLAPLFALPLTIASLMLLSHWFSLRYVIVALPSFLLLAAVGFDAIARSLTSWLGGSWRDGFAALLILAAIYAYGFFTIDRSLQEPLQKAEWRRIARELAERAHRDDTIVTSNAWSAASLRFYLGELHSPLALKNVDESIPMAWYVTSRRERLWLVSGGFHRSGETPAWFARHSALLDTDPIEEVRVEYVPRLDDFLLHRATAADVERLRRVILSGAGGNVPLDSPLFVDGWYDSERNGASRFRWATQSAAIVLPDLPASMPIRLTLDPIHQMRAVQRVLVRIDGEEMLNAALPETRTISVTLGSHAGKAPMHRMELQFATTVEPRAIGEGNDSRQLAASIQSLVIGSPTALDFGFLVRLHRRPRVAIHRSFLAPVVRWNHAELEALLLRCGYSELPSRSITRQEMTELLSDAGEEWRYRTDEEFLDGIFRLTFGRAADVPIRREHLAALRTGTKRSQVIDAIVRSGEFKRRYVARR